MLDKLQDMLFPNKRRAMAATEELMQAIEHLFDELAREFNMTAAHEPLMLSLQRPSQACTTNDTKPVSSDAITSANQIEPRASANQIEPQENFQRLIVSTSFWALSVKGMEGTVDCFLLPSTELTNLPNAETASRSKLRLTYDERTKVWNMDTLPVSESELNTLCRSLLKDLIVRSQGDYDLLPDSTRLVWNGLSLTRSVRSLVAEKHTLMQKIVDQQEAILNMVARDLHDAVLGNVMLLERSLSSEKGMDRQEMCAILAQIGASLRDVCHDLYPRDLKDIGLAPLLAELCSSFFKRTGVECRFEEKGEMPELSDEVLLHVFRIAQECFNNISKHANATLVECSVVVNEGLFTLTIKDNGQGILDGNRPAMPKESEGKSVPSKDGRGTSIIKERAELIDCIYPCRVRVESEEGKGTALFLEIMFASKETT